VSVTLPPSPTDVPFVRWARDSVPARFNFVGPHGDDALSLTLAQTCAW